MSWSLPAFACDHCGAIQTRQLYHNRDYISGELFALGECLDCGLVRTMVESTDQDQRRYYDAAYYGQAGRRFPEIMEGMIRQFRHWRVRTIYQHCPTPGRILDIGCGRGLMLGELHQQGWTCLGTEAEPALAKAVENRYGFPVQPLAAIAEGDFTPASFDVITLWHVLEHMAKPITTLRTLHRLLKPEGILIIETPNHASLQSRMGRGRWFHLDTPRHLYHFSARTLPTILQEQGLQILSRRTFSAEYGVYGFYQTLLNCLTYQPNVLYAQLKSSRPAEMGLRRWQRGWDEGITLFASPPAFGLGAVLEVLAALVGQAGVIQIVAKA